MSETRDQEGGLLGAVLAGGSSRRLGRDKAAERIGGRRMVDRAIAALEAHCEEVVVVSSRPETPSGTWRRIEDARPAGGPLCGIEAALIHADTSGHTATVILAVDLPLVGVAHVGALVDAWHDSGPDVRAVAAAREGEPDFEPLCAVYATACLPDARSLLDRGERAAQALFRSVGGLRVGGLDGVGLNVNDERDLDEATAALEPGE